MRHSKNLFIEMKNIKKVFPGTIANNNVSIKVHKGEVISLLGENGAGKTTLMKILYGMYKADYGEIKINGEKVNISSPQKAKELGIGMIHQHFTLVPVHTVLENVMLQMNEAYNPKSIKEKIKIIGNKYQLKVDPKAVINELPVGFQQRVEIIKALLGSSKLLIMDEPTAVLTPQETDKLFNFIREFKKEGNSVIFITHKLNEVMEISDRVVVLRDGKKIDSITKNEADKDTLTKMMIGREFDFEVKKNRTEIGEKILEVDNISLVGEKGNRILNNLSLDVKAGEIFGVAGVSGNGQEELADALTGQRDISAGDIRLKGKSIANLKSREILNIGVGYIPADRQKVGLVLDMTVEENLILKSTYDSRYFNKYAVLKSRELREDANQKIQNFNIKVSSPEASAHSLSGGNQQKVVVAREVTIGKKMLVASQPTRGLDFGAACYVKETLESEKSKGKAILLISNELSEIMELSDRIGVIYEGEILDVFEKNEVDINKIGLLMTGVRGDSVEK
jgi:simple sugar transport system ATP-binding protein